MDGFIGMKTSIVTVKSPPLQVPSLAPERSQKHSKMLIRNIEGKFTTKRSTLRCLTLPDH